MEFRKWLESSGLEAFLSALRERHPGLRLEAYETKEKIELMSIEVPEGSRGMGVGTEIIRNIQDYARKVGKPIVLRPEAEKGRKGDLDRFYRGLGFVHNRGRNTNFVLSSPTSRTMYWNPLDESYMTGHRPPKKDYGAPMHDLTVLYPPDVYDNIFQYMSDHSQREAAMKVSMYRNKPDGMLEVYRAVPDGVASINPGDWVAMTRGYAETHAMHPTDRSMDMSVISAKVRAGDLYNDGNSMEEWGYWGPSVGADYVSECLAEATTPKVIMYHGTAFRNLRSIMSHGLIPRPRGRAWQEDPDSSFHSASRASLDGVYLTRNLMTALSAASNGANRKHMEEGDLLIAVEVQPKTLFADEDDLNFMATVSSMEMQIADLYYSLEIVNSKGDSTPDRFPNGAPIDLERVNQSLEEARKKYRDRFFDRIGLELKLNPMMKNRLSSMVDAVFEAAVRRQAVYVGYYLKNYFKTEAPDKARAEMEFMKARERLTRTMKSLANPFKYSQEPFNLTGRLEDPIGFRGTNKIVCVLHVPFDYKQRPRLVYGDVPEDLVRQWEERRGEWMGVEK